MVIGFEPDVGFVFIEKSTMSIQPPAKTLSCKEATSSLDARSRPLMTEGDSCCSISFAATSQTIAADIELPSVRLYSAAVPSTPTAHGTSSPGDA
jgi:hypothetical protein